MAIIFTYQPQNPPFLPALLSDGKYRLMSKLQEHIEYKADIKAWLKHIK